MFCVGFFCAATVQGWYLFQGSIYINLESLQISINQLAINCCLYLAMTTVKLLALLANFAVTFKNVVSYTHVHSIHGRKSCCKYIGLILKQRCAYNCDPSLHYSKMDDSNMNGLISTHLVKITNKWLMMATDGL